MWQVGQVLPSVDFDLAYISLDYIAVSLCVCVCGKVCVCKRMNKVLQKFLLHFTANKGSQSKDKSQEKDRKY